MSPARRDPGVRGRRVLAPARGDEDHDDRAEHIDTVLFGFGRVLDQRYCERGERRGHERGARLEEPAGHEWKERERREASEERRQPERQLTVAQQGGRQLGREQVRRGSALVVVQRPGDEVERGAVEDVAGDRDLVDPQRGAAEILPGAQRRAHDEERDDQPCFTGSRHGHDRLTAVRGGEGPGESRKR